MKRPTPAGKASPRKAAPRKAAPARTAPHKAASRKAAPARTAVGKPSPRKASAPRRARNSLREQARGVYREAILEAAEAALAERGFAGTRMADVAARAGLAIGTLYNYVTNKAELVVTLIEERAGDFERDLGRRASEATSGRAVLDALVRTSLDHFEAHRALFELFESGGLSGRDFATVESRCDTVRASYHGAFSAALARAAELGALRRGLPIDDVAEILGGAIQGVARAWIADGATGSLLARAPLLVDVFLCGVGPTR